MIKSKIINFSVIAIILVILTSCNKSETDTIPNINSDYEYLKGTWVDMESYALSFIDFYSESQARFGLYGKNFERYTPFNYRIIESNQIAIDFLEDNATTETLHRLIRKGNDTIEISDFTEIPENPNKIYVRREIITEKYNNTIIIGHNQEFYDFENGFRLQIDSVLNDSRCPIGATCIWEGDAEVRLSLILQGNYHHYITLNTNQAFHKDTVINNIKFDLVRLEPYPEIDKQFDIKEYVAKIIIEKQ